MALKNCPSEVATQAWGGGVVNEVASLAKKPVLLTVMLINIILNIIHSQLLFFFFLQSCSFTVVSQRYQLKPCPHFCGATTKQWLFSIHPVSV